MKQLPLILFFIPLLSFAQFPLDRDYLFVNLELDPKNLLVGSDKNEPALDVVAKFGYRAKGGFQMNFAYEQFDEIRYKSTYFEFGHFWNDENRFQQGLMAGAGFVFRDVDWTKYMSCTLSISGNLEYHLTNWFFTSAKLEGRYRGDLRKIIPSGYMGIGVKLFNQR